MVICPDCGKEVPDAKFCKNCGARLPEIEEVKPMVEDIELPDNDEVQISENVVGDIEDEIPVSKTTQNQNTVNFCRNCGYKLDGNYKFCPNCGFNLETQAVSRSNSVKVTSNTEKNIIISIILSVIFPGLGQIYLGLDKKGSLFLIGYVVSLILILLFVGLILCLIIWIWALVDTINSTNALNRGENVEDKLF